MTTFPGEVFSRNGFRRSWTITAYSLIGDAQPAPMPEAEDLPPENIDTHPYQGPVLLEHPLDAAWNEAWSEDGAIPLEPATGDRSDPTASLVHLPRLHPPPCR